MKKGFILIFTSLILVLAACGTTKSSENKDANSGASVGDTQASDNSMKEVRSSLLSYNGDIIKLIRTYEGLFVSASEDPSIVLSDLAKEVEKELLSVKIPENLNDQKEELTSAVNNLIQYYASLANVLESGAEDRTEVDQFKQSFINEMNSIFEEIELAPPAFSLVF